ncbi:MAG: c-type cytochrome biogenesis protein CcmI [Pseudomonadota bacterium]
MIIFWAITGTLTAAVALILVRTALRADAGDAASDTEKDMAIYKAQLSEVDRDIDRGVIGAAEAETLRTEISRRLLAVDAAGQKAVTERRAPLALTLGAAGATVALCFALYAYLGAPGYGDMPLEARLAAIDERAATRPSQTSAQLAFATTAAQPEVSERHRALVADLRAAMADRPDDLQGLELLMRNEAALGNYDAAFEAQRRIIALKGDDVGYDDILTQAELMITAAGGYVSPEAEAELRRAGGINPDSGEVRYYLGLMHQQSGRYDRAFALWAPLMDNAQPGDSWVPFLRDQLPRVAQLAGVRYVLPEGRGPSQEDLLAAQELSPEDRAAMIEGMVQGLAQRLATQGGPPEDWARLITARAVLGDRDSAQAILGEARQVFADRADALNLFARTARDAGLQ